MGAYPSISKFKGCLTFLLITFALIPTALSAAVPNSIRIEDDAAHLSRDHITSDSVDEMYVRGGELTTTGFNGHFESNTSPGNDEGVDGLEPAPDPYHWRLVCRPEADPDAFMSLTQTCLTRRFKCDGEGKLTHREDNAECEEACKCHQWSNEEGNSPVINQPRALDDVPSSYVEKELSFEYVDVVSDLPQSEQRSLELQQSKLDGTDDFSDPKLHLLTRAALHDWGVACFGSDGKENTALGRFCVASPYGYTCNANHQLGWRREQSACRDFCRCHHHNTNPKPIILNWSSGQVPKGGSWGKRSVPLESENPQEDATDGSPQSLRPKVPEPLLGRGDDAKIDGKFADDQTGAYVLDAVHNPSVKKVLHAWGPVCSLRDAQGNVVHNGNFTRYCTQAPWSYSCDHRGALISGGYNLICEDGCKCKNFNPRPLILFWPYDKVPKPGSWSVKQYKEIVTNTDDHTENANTNAVQQPSTSTNSEPPEAAAKSNPPFEDVVNHAPKGSSGRKRQLNRRGAVPSEFQETGGTFSARDKRIVTHTMAIACSEPAGNSRDWAEICIGDPFKYRCDEVGKMTHTQRYDECDRNCLCPNLLPRVINSTVGQPPKGDSWDRQKQHHIDDGSSAAVSKVTNVSKAVFQHEHPPGAHVFYELICFKDGSADETLTKSCDFDPWVYWCDMSGNLTMLLPRDDCQRLCHCVPENIRPIVLNWPADRIPLPGQWKRARAHVDHEAEDASDRDGAGDILPVDDEIYAVDSLETADSQASQDLIDAHHSKRRPLHDWAMICYPNDSPSKVWTQLCHNEPWKYECTDGGKMQYKRKYDQCDRLCQCSNVNPRPYFPLGVIPVSPPRSLVDDRLPVSRLQRSGEPHGEALDDRVGSLSETSSGIEKVGLEKRHEWSPMCGRWDTSAMTLIPDIGLTNGCMASPYLFNCNAKGERLFGKNQSNQKCRQACSCVDMDPQLNTVNWLASQVPKTASWNKARSTQNDGDFEHGLQRQKRHGFAPVCQEYDESSAMWIDNDPVTRRCMASPFKYNCDQDGKLTYEERKITCDGQCLCRNLNPKPPIFNWLKGQKPKSGSWSKKNIVETKVFDRHLQNDLSTSANAYEASADAGPDAEGLEPDRDSSSRFSGVGTDTPIFFKRHDYSIVCELDGKRDAEITAACTHPPRSYSCDKRGVLSKEKYDSYCDQHCACHNMNPRPIIINSPRGSMPKPCIWCKRDQNGEVIDIGDVSDDEMPTTVDAKTITSAKGDVVWVMDCNSKDGSQNMELISQCGLEKQAGCDDGGQLYSEPGAGDGECASMCFCYPRPA